VARPDPERLALWWAFDEAHREVMGSVGARLSEECDLSLVSFTVLDRLYEARGRLRLHDLADQAGLPPSTLTRVVDRLVGSGLVERVPAADDGRGALASLTREGRVRYRAAVTVFRRAVHKGFARHLTDTDVVALQRVLVKLRPATVGGAEGGATR